MNKKNVIVTLQLTIMTLFLKIDFLFSELRDMN